MSVDLSGHATCTCQADLFRQNDDARCNHVRACHALGLLADNLGEVSPVPTVPDRSMTFLEVLESQRKAYQSWKTPTGTFLADLLGRQIQLAAWVESTTPEDLEDRVQAVDEMVATATVR